MYHNFIKSDYLTDIRAYFDDYSYNFPKPVADDVLYNNPAVIKADTINIDPAINNSKINSQPLNPVSYPKVDIINPDTLTFKEDTIKTQIEKVTDKVESNIQTIEKKIQTMGVSDKSFIYLALAVGAAGLLTLIFKD